MDFDESDASGSDSGYESEEQLRPTFVPREQRLTLEERQRQQDEERLRAEKRELEQALRKNRTRAELAESIRKAAEGTDLGADGYDSERGLPDCGDDSTDPQLEIKAWKVREITRLKRDVEERERSMLERAEILRRRNLTDEERHKEDEAAGRFEAKEKPKMKFLQKYYHKGVFYIDEQSLRSSEDVRAKEYVEPTLGDHVDKEKLPKILQVKNFGKRSRTKYTHLVDQDTTLRDSRRVDLRPDQRVLEKYKNRMGGLHG